MGIIYNGCHRRSNHFSFVPLVSGRGVFPAVDGECALARWAGVPYVRLDEFLPDTLAPLDAVPLPRLPRILLRAQGHGNGGQQSILAAMGHRYLPGLHAGQRHILAYAREGARDDAKIRVVFLAAPA